MAFRDRRKKLKKGSRQLEDNDFDVLLKKARSGDAAALEVIFERFKGTVRAKSRIYFLVGADGEDLIQEGMIGLYKAINDYRDDAGTSFKVFADMCITRQIITAVKTAGRQKHTPLNCYVSLSKPISFEGSDSGGAGAEDRSLINMLRDTALSDPEDALIKHEQNLKFEHDLRRLLSELERAILSRYLEGAPYHEIASSLGKPEKSIDNALQRVRRKLLKYLKNKRDF